MSRLFTRHAARWMTIGIISIFAVDGFPGIAAACEGAGEEAQGKLVFLNKKGGIPLSEPLVVSVAKPVEGVAEYQANGILETKALTQTINPEPLFEDNGGDCEGNTLKNTETCEVKIKCEKEEATMGSLSVKAPVGVDITGAQRKLKCVK
jgi:hypothetical protein